MHSEQQKLYFKHQSMSKICKFEDWSVSGQKDNGLKEHGTSIIVMKNDCFFLFFFFFFFFLVGFVFRSTIKVVKV